MKDKIRERVRDLKNACSSINDEIRRLEQKKRDLYSQVSVLNEKIESFPYVESFKLEREKLLLEKQQAGYLMKKKFEELGAIKFELKQLTGEEDEVKISDHALARYMERIEGMDLDALRGKILTPDLRSLIEKLDSATINLGNGYAAVVRNKTILTFRPVSYHTSHTRPDKKYPTYFDPDECEHD